MFDQYQAGSGLNGTDFPQQVNEDIRLKESRISVSFSHCATSLWICDQSEEDAEVGVNCISCVGAVGFMKCSEADNKSLNVLTNTTRCHIMLKSVHVSGSLSVFTHSLICWTVMPSGSPETKIPALCLVA